MEEHLEDLDSVEPVPLIEFEVNDSVVYPHHGAGKVIRKEQKEILGERREYLTIKILHNDMTVMVPTENAALAGLRRVIDEETVQKVLAVLQDECSEMPKNWNRRFKYNRDKIKTGDIYELAEVVRNLGELVDVAGLDLVAVVLEATVPVLRHLGALVLEHCEHLLDRLLVDH